MPVTKERLHICARWLFIQFWINFIMRGRKSSHPAPLSLKLHIILYISSSVTVDAKNFSDISNLMYSLGHLLVEGISLAKDSPTFTKKIIKFIGNYFPIANNITIVFEFRVDWTILSVIDDWLDNLPGFLYIGFVYFFQILVVLAFSRA